MLILGLEVNMAGLASTLQSTKLQLHGRLITCRYNAFQLVLLLGKCRSKFIEMLRILEDFGLGRSFMPTLPLFVARRKKMNRSRN